jgi:hypothetical protein
MLALATRVEGSTSISNVSLSLTNERMTSRARKEHFVAANSTALGTLTFISLVFTTECDPIFPPRPLTLRHARLWRRNVVHAWRGENAAEPHHERSTILA